MAPATPRIDASPLVSLSVGSMALLANLQRDLIRRQKRQLGISYAYPRENLLMVGVIVYLDMFVEVPGGILTHFFRLWSVGCASSLGYVRILLGYA